MPCNITTDKSEYSFAKMPIALLNNENISLGAKVLYCKIYYLEYQQKEITQEYIVKAMNMSLTKVKRMIKELKENKFLDVQCVTEKDKSSGHIKKLSRYCLMAGVSDVPARSDEESAEYWDLPPCEVGNDSSAGASGCELVSVSEAGAGVVSVSCEGAGAGESAGACVVAGNDEARGAGAGVSASDRKQIVLDIASGNGLDNIQVSALIADLQRFKREVNRCANEKEIDYISRLVRDNKESLLTNYMQARL